MSYGETSHAFFVFLARSSPIFIYVTMMDDIPTRKSGRARVPSRKVQEEAFATLSNVLSDSDGEQNHQQANGDSKKQPDDEDFPQEAAIEDQESNAVDTDFESQWSDGSPAATPPNERSERTLDDFNVGSVAANVDAVVERTKTHGSVFPRKYSTQHASVDSQKLPNTSRDRISFLAGPNKADIAHLLKVREMYVEHPTLPRLSRFAYLPIHTKEKRSMEATIGWDWYYDQGGREYFCRKQKRQTLESKPDTAKHFGIKDHLGVLMGPYGQQKLRNLGPFESLTTENAWQSGSADSEKTNDDSAQKPPPQRLPRHDWICNAGSNITCMDWVPNQPSNTQYLAIGTGSIPSGESKDNTTKSPGFEPSPPAPSAVQIWEFQKASASTAPEDVGSEVQIENAKFICAICTDWGLPRQLKWCPMPRNFRDEDSRGVLLLGLLAGIWADGYARVMDVQVEKGKLDSQRYCRRLIRSDNFFKLFAEQHRFVVKYTQTVFAVRPAQTICLSLCWLSPSDIAVGHSNGYIALYNICPSPIPATTSPEQADRRLSPPTPYLLIQPLRPGPVLCLASCYPSHPTLIASSALTGHVRLIDLKNPNSDTIESTRSRVASPTIAYCPHLYCMTIPDEAVQTIKIMGIRFWGSGTSIGKTSVRPVGNTEHGGGVGVVGRGCLDTGKVHSVVAWGTPDGRVSVTNPVGRLFGASKMIPILQQVICRHEWVSTSTALYASKDKGAGDETIAANAESGQIRDTEMANGIEQSTHQSAIDEKWAGIVRITEGYKPERVDLAGVHAGQSRTTTLFEENTGVTAVCWNPNLQCGGWLAMSWGSGLVRIQDVAV